MGGIAVTTLSPVLHVSVGGESILEGLGSCDISKEARNPNFDMKSPNFKQQQEILKSLSALWRMHRTQQLLSPARALGATAGDWRVACGGELAGIPLPCFPASAGPAYAGREGGCLGLSLQLSAPLPLVSFPVVVVVALTVVMLALVWGTASLFFVSYLVAGCSWALSLTDDYSSLTGVWELMSVPSVPPYPAPCLPWVSAAAPLTVSAGMGAGGGMLTVPCPVLSNGRLLL